MVINCSDVVQPNRTDTGHIIFQRVAYTPVFILGLILNASALWCFIRTPKWTLIHIYMLNLLLADLLLTVFLPFRIFETYYPMKVTGFCTFLICVHYINMYTSVIIITAISIYRYMVVRFPMNNKTSGASEARRKKITSGICAVIWLVITTLSVSFSKNMSPEQLKTCYAHKCFANIKLEFLLVLEISGYLLPVVTITACSTQAIWTVLKSLKDVRQHTEEEIIDERKRLVAIVTANMIVFIVCFTPIHVSYLLRYITKKDSSSIHIFAYVSEWLATTNCCLDSVGYYFLLKKFS